MRLRQLWILLSGITLFVVGLLVGVSAPAGAETGGGCAGSIGEASPPPHCRVPVSSAAAGDLGTSGGRATLGSPRVECTLGGRNVLVDVHNSDSVDVEVTVTIGGVSTALTLAPGGHETVRTPADSGTTSVRAVIDGITVIDTVIDTTCGVAPPPTTTSVPPTTTSLPPTTTSLPPTTTIVPPPVTAPPVVPPPTTTTVPPVPLVDVAAAQLVDCAAGEVQVLLGNFGTASVMVDVAVPRAALQPAITLDGGGLALSFLGIDALGDGPAEVRVSDSVTGELYVRNDVDIDCVAPAEPVASVVVDCASGVIHVELANVAGGPAELTVLQERVAVVAETTLAAGESTVVDIGLGGQRPVLVRVVDGDGNDVLREAVDHECDLADDPTDEPDVDPVDSGDANDDGDGADAEGSASDSESVECAAAVDIAPSAGDDGREYQVSVELDGTVVIDGRGRGDASLPVVPGVPTRIVVSDPAQDLESVVRSSTDSSCADVEITMVPDCAASSASITLERTGVGRERFVVLVDGRVGGVLSIDGSGSGTVPLKIGSRAAEVTVARSDAADPVVVGTLMCDRSAGISGPVAASLATIAVLAMAAGVLPWRSRLQPV